jgi:hypothetical protein
MSRTTRTTTATASPARTPVPGNSHPLGGSPDSFAHVEPPSVDAPPVPVRRDGPDSTANPPPVNTEIEDSKDDAGLSARDADLSGYDTSSLDGDSEFGPPNLTDLILLGPSTCRAPTQIMASDLKAKVSCACGQPVLECKRHAQHRIEGRYRHPPGYI